MDRIDKLRISGYIHTQILSSKTWIINHTLNKYPSVTIVDTSGNIVIGDVKYISNFQLEVNFNAQFSGVAYLS